MLLGDTSKELYSFPNVNYLLEKRCSVRKSGQLAVRILGGRAQVTLRVAGVELEEDAAILRAPERQLQ